MTPESLDASYIVSFVCAALIYSVMLLMAAIILKFNWFTSIATKGSTRYGAVDGMRGMLAIGVMVHHTSAAYGYFSTGIWQYGQNSFLNQLGHAGVALFFMITGFLFFIKASSGEMKWRDFFLSRFFRLFPLYALVVTAVVVIVMVMTGWIITVTPSEFIDSIVKWYTFVIFGRPEINGYKNTALLIAGVNWTLKYEILFYVFCVPTIYYITGLGGRLAACMLLIGLCLILTLLKWIFDLNFNPCTFYFLIGSLIAYGYSIPQVKEIYGHKFIKALSVIAFFTLIAQPSRGSIALLCMSIIFASIVGGASIYGLLKTKYARWLGDISYGIYLIHGLILWMGINILIKFNLFSGITMVEYMEFACLLAVSITIIASLSYRFVEYPAIMMGKKKKRAQAAHTPRSATAGQDRKENVPALSPLHQESPTTFDTASFPHPTEAQ